TSGAVDEKRIITCHRTSGAPTGSVGPRSRRGAILSAGRRRIGTLADVSDLLGSIVIPAYNEGAVIRRCLERVFDGLDPREVEVVVACNGCTDDTATQAKEAGFPVAVLELPTPGKVGALRAGERSVQALPRIYLDADVEVTGATLRAVLEALRTGAVAARPS